MIPAIQTRAQLTIAELRRVRAESAANVERIAETCYGTFVLLVKRGIVVTLWRVA